MEDMIIRWKDNKLIRLKEEKLLWFDLWSRLLRFLRDDDY